MTGPLSDRPSFAVTRRGNFLLGSARTPVHQGSIQFLSFSTGRSQPVVVTERPIRWGPERLTRSAFSLSSLKRSDRQRSDAGGELPVSSTTLESTEFFGMTLTWRCESLVLTEGSRDG